MMEAYKIDVVLEKLTKIKPSTVDPKMVNISPDVARPKGNHKIGRYLLIGVGVVGAAYGIYKLIEYLNEKDENNILNNQSVDENNDNEL